MHVCVYHFCLTRICVDAITLKTKRSTVIMDPSIQALSNAIAIAIHQAQTPARSTCSVSVSCSPTVTIDPTAHFQVHLHHKLRRWSKF